MGSEHAVIVHLPLRVELADNSAYQELEDALIEAIESSGIGEFDGNEFGEGECVFYIYGADADELFSAIEPHLHSAACASGGYAVKRYGDVSDSGAKEIRVQW